MSITIDLHPQVEAALQSEAARNGVAKEELASRLISREFREKPMTARALMALPVEKRRAYLEATAEAAAPLYDDDLAKPEPDRELTAFTALDADPAHEYGA